jgi:transposase
VLRWFNSKINNGILEGLNSLIQAAKTKARSYRTFKNLKTIIYMLTGKLDYLKVGLPT